MKRPTSARILPFRPNRSDLEIAIRQLAQDSGCVFLSTHARDRMVERGITRQDAIKVLRNGFIEGEITSGKKIGEWRCKVVAKIKGSREIGVVTIVVVGHELLVKTVEWEDL